MRKLIIILILTITSKVFGQNLLVFDIDSTNFPIMKTKFYVFDANYKQIRNLSISDFKVTENGQARKILKVSCPAETPPKPISSVLVIDASGSMKLRNLDIAIEGAKAWIESVPLGKSDCAITAFNDYNWMLQDFTNDKAKLVNSLNNIQAMGGTNYNAALMDSMAGGLIVTSTATNKRIIVFLTDGQPNRPPDIDRIVAEANKQNATIYSIVLGMKCPDILKEISVRTGGLWFENVSSAEEAKAIYLTFLQLAQEAEPCELEWETGIPCDISTVNLKIEIPSMNLAYNTSYKSAFTSIANMKFEPTGIFFANKTIGVQADTTITVTAENFDYQITNITSTNPLFDINPKSFYLGKDESKQLTVSFTPTDSSYTSAYFLLETDRCFEEFFSAGGFAGVRPKVRTLKLTHPNGGEEFLVGSDTVISWEGILPADEVSLQYSTNNGTNWINIANNANGLKYPWINIPYPESKQCLMKVTQGEVKFEHDIEWQKSYGGSVYDFAQSIQQTSDGGYIAGGYTNSTDGDITSYYGDLDNWVMKLDENGAIEWQKSYGGTSDESFGNIVQTSDGGYIFAGSTRSADKDLAGIHAWSNGFDYWIVKINSKGTIEWQKCYGGKNNDIVSSIQQTIDGGYIVAGTSNSTDGDVTGKKGADDYWILKLDNIGNKVWDKSLGGSLTDVVSSIRQTTDGGYIIAGSSTSNNGDITNHYLNSDFWIVKLSPSGVIDWQRSYGGDSFDFAYSIIQTSEGGYIVAGTSSSNNGDVTGGHMAYDVWLLKISPLGAIDWQKCLGGSQNDYATDIVQSYDGGYLVCGYTASLDGDVSGINGFWDYWVLKVNPIGAIEWQKCLGGLSDDKANAIQQTKDGGVIIAGYSNSKDGDITNNHGDFDAWIVKLSPDNIPFQSDTSDAVFSIVAPRAEAKDLDMGKVLVNTTKDSVVVGFLQNSQNFPCRIDSIYFEGADANQFGTVWYSYPLILESNTNQDIEFLFKPNSVGIKNAEIVIVTQSETLRKKITGEGIEPLISFSTNILDFGIVQLGANKVFIDTALIKNNSNLPIEITDVVMLGPDYLQFSIVSGGGQFTLQPNEVRKLDVMFRPIYSGRTSGQLGFVFNGIGSPAITQLFGQGTGTPTLRMSNDSANVGRRRYLQLLLGNMLPQGLSLVAPNFEAKIRFQSTILAPLKNPDWYISNDSTFVTLKGKIDTSNVLAELYVRAGLGTVEETTLDIIEFKLLDNLGKVVEYEFEKYSGMFKLLGICRDGGTRLINPAGKAGIESIAPNPAGSSIEIEFSTNEIGYTEIAIYNTLGEKVLTAFSEDISETGKRNIKLNSSKIGNGTYMVIFKSPTVVDTKQIMIVK